MSENRRIKRWQHAAAKYEGASGANAERDFAEEINEILKLPNSEEWPCILRLLKASKKEIQIGFAEGGQGEVGYFLTKDGFAWKQMRNGAMYEGGISSEPDAVRRLAEAFRNLHPSDAYGSFNGVVFGEVEKIADARPRSSTDTDFLKH